MSANPFIKSLVAILTIMLVAPSAFLIAPQKTQAFGPTWIVGDTSITGLITPVETTITAVQSVLSGALDVTNTAANYANMINAYVLQPLAFVLSGNLMKALTSSVIGFVIGKANGTGVPQFVTDIQKSMQTVADGKALAYLRQINQTKSPFSSSIRSALASNYLSKSSLAGFWAANMNTLARSSPNVPAYLSGNWSQGGVAAWFSLTTQTQNNPYSLYQNAQGQLLNIVGPGVGGATGARAQELSFNQGFMSWCGGPQVNGVTCTSGEVYDSDTGTCVQSVLDRPEVNGINCANGEVYDSDTATCVKSVLNTSKGINPGDPCSKSDGTSGTVQTPGSVIKSTLDKVLGGQQDQIVRMGNVGPQVNQILGNIGTVLSTVNFAASLLGGDKQGGLLAVNSTSASRSISQLQQFTPTPVTDSSGKVIDFTTPTKDSLGNTVHISGYLGTTQADANTQKAGLDSEKAANEAVGATGAAAASAVASTAKNTAPSADLPGRITQYATAWDTIKLSAETASSSVLSLAQVCTKNAGVSRDPTFKQAALAQMAAVQNALTTEILPVFTKFEAASTTIDIARKAVQKVAAEASSASTYTADVQALETLSPTPADVIFAQQNTQASGAILWNSDGTINTSLILPASPSLLAQMNAINANATTLQTTVCDPVSDLYVAPLINGG